MTEGGYIWNRLSYTEREAITTRQVVEEEELLEMATAKYNEDRERLGVDGNPEQRLIAREAQALSIKYQALLDDWAENRGQGGRDILSWCPIVMGTGAATLAYITLYQLIKCLADAATSKTSSPDKTIFGVRAQTLANDIGEHVIEIHNVRVAREQNLEMWQNSSRFIKNWDRRKLNRWAKKVSTPIKAENRLKWKIGTVLLMAASMEMDKVESPIKFYSTSSGNRGKLWDTTWITLQETVIKELKDEHELKEMITRVSRPMLCPPVPHAIGRAGGHLTEWVRKNLVGNNKSTPSETHIKAINALMNTEWQVDPFILEVMTYHWTHGGGPINIPCQHEEQVFNYATKEAWESVRNGTEEEKNFRNQKATEEYEYWNKQASARFQMERRLSIAKSLSHEKCFYMPWNFDFRGRMYPTCEALSCQGSDMDKYLIQFTRPDKTTHEGLHWRKVSIANAFGIDKVPHAERVQWVDDNIDMLKRICEDPYVNKEWHDDAIKKNKSFERLAVTRDFFRMLDEGYSLVPVHIDGTCNGPQHWAAIMLDESVGKLVNLVDAHSPADLYTAVATTATSNAWEIIEDDSQTDEKKFSLSLAMDHFEDVIPRSVTKRPTMTIAYGLTNRSAWKYMRDDGAVTKAWCPEEHIGIVSRHLGDLIMDSLKDTEVGLMKECFKGETYLKFLAKQCADAGMPMEWVTPSGFRVHQGYWNFPVIRMAVRLATSDKSTLKEMRKELIFQDNDVKIGVDDGASIRGVSPNVIHSLDADHCARSTVTMLNVGIEDFAHVHDSYGVPPSCVSLMHPIIREEFYEMHKHYQLETIKKDVEQLLGVSLPEPPDRGGLELSRVLDSTYFFH